MKKMWISVLVLSTIWSIKKYVTQLKIKYHRGLKIYLISVLTIRKWNVGR